MADKLIIPEKIIKYVEGRALPKPGNNQNTDDMVYGGALNLITFKGYGKHLYEEERKKNPSHPLNDPKYAEAKILLGGENFGCGSSREHAPQAFLDYGIKALIAADYAGIFQSNCAATGLIAVTVQKDGLSKLIDIVQKFPSANLKIDLEEKIINSKSGGIEWQLALDIPENVRQSFLTGTWDALGILRSNKEKVLEKINQLPYFNFK